MYKKSLELCTILLLAFFFAASCAPAAIPTEASPKEVIGATILPTKTLPPTQTPTSTPRPSATPLPPTPTVPAPEKSMEYLQGVNVIFADNFEKRLPGVWGLSTGTIKNGVLDVVGKDWNGLARERTFKEKQGVIFDFTFAPASEFEMYFDVGDFYSDPYKRFGIYIFHNQPSSNLWMGKNLLNGALTNGNLRLKPGKTYTLLLAMIPEGGFLTVIWDPADPSKSLFYREIVGEKWANQTWRFAIGANLGSIQFDNYREIEFSDIKK